MLVSSWNICGQKCTLLSWTDDVVRNSNQTVETHFDCALFVSEHSWFWLCIICTHSNTCPS